MDADAVRGQVLLEESREAVVVLDADGRVIAASRRARQSLEGVREGEPLPQELLGERALVVPYAVDGRTERLVYLSQVGDLAAYEELRSGFTAAVSHELRTPLARLLSLLELALLPGENVADLVDAARREVEQIRELIDEVLFLSELESGTRVVSLGATRSCPSCTRSRPSSRTGLLGRASSSGSTATRRRPWPYGHGCCESSRRTSPRTRSATQVLGRTLISTSSGRAGRSCCRSPTTVRASPPLIFRASSNGSIEPTARAPRAAQGSGSRS